MTKHDKIPSIIREDFNWTKETVIGLALKMQGGEIDSYANPIEDNVFYEVGKRKSDGMVVILPTGVSQKTKSLNKVLDKNMNNNSQLN